MLEIHKVEVPPQHKQQRRKLFQFIKLVELLSIWPTVGDITNRSDNFHKKCAQHAIYVPLRCQDWVLVLQQEGHENISTLHRLCSDPTSDCYPAYRACMTTYYFCHPHLWAFGFDKAYIQEPMAAHIVDEKKGGRQLQEVTENCRN